MAKFLVENSGALSGEVHVSGAKNAVLPLMSASILAGDVSVIQEVPKLRDVAVMKEILSSIGGKLEQDDASESLKIDFSELTSTEADENLVKKMRASFLIMGPLLARKGHAKVYMPGGCVIGARPVELHLKGFEALGADVVVNDKFTEAFAPPGGLKGARIYLDFPSVGATENIMMAASLAEGTT